MGKIYCTQCGNENDDSSKFCSSCGEPLDNNNTTALSNKTTTLPNINLNNHKIIIIGLIAVIILLFVGILSTGIFTPNIPLQTADFGYFEMGIPEGSSFDQVNSMGNLMPQYENNGKYSEDFGLISFSTKPKETGIASDLIEENDNMKLYQISKDLRDRSGKNYYELLYEKDGMYFDLAGENPDLLKQVAETIVVKNAYWTSRST